MAALLEIEGLQTQFFTSGGIVKAVDGVSYDVEEGETVAVVGESGCGKSVSALSILRLVAEPAGKVVGGSIKFQGKDLLALTDADMRKIRGNDIAMVFQEPMTSLNPVLTIGEQLIETLLRHKSLNRKEALKVSAQLLGKVELPSPEEKLKQYPHQLSGGMRQRVMIAMALACEPKILIADEPTTGLHFEDVRKLLEVLHELVDAGNSVVVIEHNLDVIKTADWIIDLGPEGGDGGGQIIAEGSPSEICKNKNSYTGKFLKPYL